jgi:hypothetical protein
MRDLLDLIKLYEAPSNNLANANELKAFKQVLASKIKQLPDNDDTAKALQEIEDLLKHVNAGGKVGVINGELASINDPTVDAAQKVLARYLMSMDMTPRDRDQLFDLWRANKLVKIDVLLSPGKKDFSDIITGYSTNKAIEELTNEVMQIAALGQGKGEFGLSVLSKSINKQPGKGDLNISGKAVEVKTKDKGGARFTDQQVRPGAGYEQAAQQLEAFINQYDPNPGTSGANLEKIVDFYEALKTNPDLKKEAATFIGMVEQVIQLIFQGEDVSGIINDIKQGDFIGANELYAETSLNYYMNQKHDDGVLYIDIVKQPFMTVFFKNADDLEAMGLKISGDTVYVTSAKDVRLPYPQVKIIGLEGDPLRVKQAKGKAIDPAALSNQDLDAVSTGGLRGPGAKKARAPVEPDFDEKTTGRRKR